MPSTLPPPPPAPSDRGEAEALLLEAVGLRDRSLTLELVQRLVHRRGLAALAHFQQSTLAGSGDGQGQRWLEELLAGQASQPDPCRPSPVESLPHDERARSAVDAAIAAMMAEFPELAAPLASPTPPASRAMEAWDLGAWKEDTRMEPAPPRAAPTPAAEHHEEEPPSPLWQGWSQRAGQGAAALGQRLRHRLARLRAQWPAEPLLEPVLEGRCSEEGTPERMGAELPLPDLQGHGAQPGDCPLPTVSPRAWVAPPAPSSASGSAGAAPAPSALADLRAWLPAPAPRRAA